MDTIVQRFNKIKLNITSLKPEKPVNIIAVSKTFSLDHINPLSEQKNVPRDEMDWSYWSMENLQTLCYKCHKKKSGKEISEKFKLKREDKKKVNWKKIKGLFE